MAAKPRAGPAPARLEVAASTDSLASRQAPVLPSDPPGAAGDFDGFDVREPCRTRTDDPFPDGLGHGGPLSRVDGNELRCTDARKISATTPLAPAPEQPAQSLEQDREEQRDAAHGRRVLRAGRGPVRRLRE